MSFNYDESLKNFGIDESNFAKLNLESDKVLEIINLAKNKIIPEPVKEFIGKDDVIAELGCEDITAEQVLAYAKIGLNPPVDKIMQEKATAYDKIIDELKDTAISNAFKAQGDNFNETIVKKMLDVLSYDEIVIQNSIWEKQAKEALNAGIRVSVPEPQINTYGTDTNKQQFIEEDYKF